ncbi:MAG: hypothetical protein OHK0038_15780 [Flammeovirgaceae bacterium]
MTATNYAFSTNLTAFYLEKQRKEIIDILQKDTKKILLIYEGAIEATREPYQSYLFFVPKYGWVRASLRQSGGYFGVCLWGKDLVNYYIEENIHNHPERTPINGEKFLQGFKPFEQEYDALMSDIKNGKIGYQVHKGLLVVYHQGNFYDIAYDAQTQSPNYGEITKLYKFHNPFDFLFRHIVERRVQQFIFPIPQIVMENLKNRLNTQHEKERLFLDVKNGKVELLGGGTSNDAVWTLFSKGHSFFIRMRNEENQTDEESVRRIILENRFHSIRTV